MTIKPASFHEVDVAEELLVRNERGFSSLNSQLVDLRSRAAGIVHRMDRSYWLGRIEMLLGMQQTFVSHDRTAASHFLAARHYALDTLEQQEFSDAWRLLSDAMGQLLLIRGPVFQFLYGMKARDAALRALDLDFGNIRAHIAAAGWYLNAPSFAGGDTGHAVDILEQAGGTDNITKLEQFLVCCLLAYAYYESDATDYSVEFYKRALNLYPKSAWLKSIGRSIELA